MTFDDLQEAMDVAKKQLPTEPTLVEVVVHEDTIKNFAKKFGRPHGKNPRFRNIKVTKSNLIEGHLVFMTFSDKSFQVINLATGKGSKRLDHTSERDIEPIRSDHRSAFKIYNTLNVSYKNDR